jgi:hypothetical protein
MRQHHGAEDLMRLLKLIDEPQDLPPPPTAIFVSIDLEVSRHERAAFLRNGSVPRVKELGIATLDTRHIFAPVTKATQTTFIETHQFSTSQASSDYEDCDFSDFSECSFAETFRISQDQVASTLNRYLRVKDDMSDDDADKLRQIVLVGHSIQRDLLILQAKGVDVMNAVILDTHLLSHNISSKWTTKPTNFALSGVFTYLECPYSMHELHNAGNDATLTLHALLRLALKFSDGQQVVSAEKANIRDTLRLFVNNEISQARRWKPIRRPLGAHLVEE